jgi:hypothetical protein
VIAQKYIIDRSKEYTTSHLRHPKPIDESICLSDMVEDLPSLTIFERQMDSQTQCCIISTRFSKKNLQQHAYFYDLQKVLSEKISEPFVAGVRLCEFAYGRQEPRSTNQLKVIERSDHRQVFRGGGSRYAKLSRRRLRQCYES